MLLLVMASSLMYFAERGSQPDIFSSIPAAAWWGIATMTTVGYGDAYPITVAGKIQGSMVAILGVAVFAVPTGIIGSAFADQLKASKQGGAACPHCGESLGS